MAKKEAITPRLKNTAVRFARAIENEGITIAKVIIFGSYAKGMASRQSDIDLCIVSPEFGKDPVGELQFLLKQSRKIDDRIEPIPVSVDEYRDTVSPLIFEVKKFGKEIFLN